MDLITTALIAGLTAGATSGASETLKKAISDGYESLKSLVKKKFDNRGEIAEAIEKLQANPQSSPRQGVLAEEMARTTAAKDPELLAASNALLEIIRSLPQGEEHIQQIAHGVGIAQASGGSTATVNIATTGNKSDV
jgi:hypothetical protein